MCIFLCLLLVIWFNGWISKTFSAAFVWKSAYLEWNDFIAFEYQQSTHFYNFEKKTIYDIRHALLYKFRPPKVRQVLADLQIDKRNKPQKGGPKYGQK